MDLLDRPTLSPTDDTLVQSQVVLFAAALFIGCTIFDVQSAKIDVSKFFPFGDTPVSQQAAKKAKPTPAAIQATAQTEIPQPFLKTVGLRAAMPQRSAEACLRATPEPTPAPLHAWRKARGGAVPEVSLIALVD